MLTTRRRAFLLGSGALALAWPGRANAAGVSAELRVSATSLKVGDSLDLELEVTRAGGGPVPDPELPNGLADAFEVVSSFSSGSGFQMSFGRGATSRTSHSSIAVSAIALKPGTHKLSFTVDDGGTKVTSNVVEVVVEGDAAAASTTAAAAPTIGKPTEARGDVFVWSATSKAKAYVGEQIEYRLDVYERSLLSSVTLRTPPNFADFYTYDLPEGEAVVEEVAGVPYRVRPGMRRALFPQKAGTLVIGSPEITIGRRRRDRGPAVSVEVSPLPAKGQPPGFSPNNVGNFTITAKVDRTSVEVGQPFTWTVEIAGEGNVALVDPGAWPEFAGARRYEPKIESEMSAQARVTGRRTYAFLVIPETPGPLQIPALTLNFFDPIAERYAVARTEPSTIEVSGTATTPTPSPEADTPAAAEADDAALQPILDAATLPRDPVPSPWLTPARWGWAMLALPSLAASAWTAAALWRRYGPDDAAKRRAAQQRRRRDRLDAARTSVDTGEGFHVALATLLHDLAVGRVGPQGVGLPRPELMRLVEASGTPAAELRRLEGLLERCDAARFAAQRGTVDERRDMLEDAVALLESSSLGREASAKAGGRT
jgi:hypothetical protein